ncbi:MAG: hypothetical protein ACREO4_06140 [Lysobacter sp.]
MAQRHDQWAHIHVAGNDRNAAAPYVSEARKLMGMVTADAAYNGLQTHQMTRRYESGAVITAEIRGGIPRMTIVPPPPGGGERVARVRENFVIRMRSATAPDGIDPDAPETMERVDDGAWRTLFHTADTPGYVGFPGKKGTYKSNNGVVVFPDGVNHAGNVDWCSDDGRRVSWYGPSTRYFFDPYVKPRTQYGKHVFMLGQVLLDVEQYITDSDPDPAFDARWVMGAALRGTTELVVVHAVLPEPVWPTGTAPEGDHHMSMPWPVEDTVLEVCRYALAPTAEAPFVRVLAGSREVLATTSVRNALNPWFFNASVSEAVSFALPDNVFARRDLDGYGLLEPAPSASSLVATLVLDGDTATLGTAALALPPAGSAAIAADYRGDTRVDLLATRYISEAGYDARALVLGDTEIRLRDVYDPRDINGRPGSTFDRRHLIWADLRAGTLVVHNTRRWMRLNATSPTLYHQIEVHRDGALVHTHELVMRTEYDAEWTGLPRLDAASSPLLDDENNPMRAATMAPAHVLYEILDWSPNVSFRQYWQGAHGLYLNLAYPDTEYFGSLVEARDAGTNPYVEFSTVAATQAQFNYVQQDVHEHYSVLGCATHEDTVVFSGWRVNLGGYVEDEHVALFAAPPREGFPMLGGGEYRFHPVWLLGTVPQLQAA